MTDKAYRVRAGYCLHSASDEVIYDTLRRLTEPLERSWARLEAARCVAIKVNLVWYPDRMRATNGRLQELVDPAVLRALLRLLRERISARLVVADTSLMFGENAGADVHFRPLLADYGVEFIDCNTPPSVEFEVPGGGQMFDRYLLHPILREADEVISATCLKSHAFMGVTLTTKNLFGLCPIHDGNRPRQYYHHIIRMPYFLADLGRVLNPCLNIVDGLVGQSTREWGGEARVTDTLVAGDHPIATDICGATLMGNDPTADWPTPPFRRDRNHLRCAAEAGFGPASVAEVDFEHDLPVPVGSFDSEATDSAERVANWRRSMCEQALDYFANRAKYEAKYPNRYILLQDGVVLWEGEILRGLPSRRKISGAKPDRAIWLKYVDPADWEAEHFEVYSRELAGVPA